MQSQKIPSGIVTNDCDKVTFYKLMQLLNIYIPIVVTLSGITIDSRL